MSYEQTQQENQVLSLTGRDLLAIFFRHQRMITISFVGVLLGAVLAAVVLPKYEAQTELLIGRERVDPVVSPEQGDPVTLHAQVTEEELNSEMELLHSEDVLRKVVVACGLDQRRSLVEYIIGRRPQPVKTEKAIRKLDKDLDLEVIKKSNMIKVTYDNSDPQLAAEVLKTLDTVYLEKHSKVHRPSGQTDFFDRETERYKKALTAAEAQLKGFANHDGETSPQVLRDMTLQKLGDFTAALHQTQTDMSDTHHRIQELEKQMGKTPARLTTQQKNSDDAGLLQQLKTTLLTLELKRTELLTKYQADYPLVQQVDKEIAKARSELEKAERRPIKEETTDENPTYQWLDGELAKAQAELAGQQARATAMQQVVHRYEQTVSDLEHEGLVQHNLLLAAKTAEENYLLYQQKREQARIDDALDATRILNVAVAEEPVVPALTHHSPLLYGLLGILLGGMITVMSVFMLEHLDQSFHTPAEVESILNIPVLAAVPYNGMNGNGSSRNGHGRIKSNTNGNGAHSGPVPIVPETPLEEYK